VLRFPKDPAFDTACGEMLCVLMRRDPRVSCASHATDYDGFRLEITTKHERVLDILADAAAVRLAVIRKLLNDVRLAMQTVLPLECV